MAKVIIFGTNEMAQLHHYYLTHDSPHEVVAFTVDQDYIKQKTLYGGLPVVPFEEVDSIYPPTDYKMRIAIFYGNVNKNRAEKYYEAKAKGYELINYISSKAITWPGLVIGDNCWIGDNNVCQPFVTIGNNVTIMEGCTIAHHSVIEDHCFLSGQVAVLGGATVKSSCLLGANSTIRNDITIAEECVIGAGALILENTQAKSVYRGNSAILLPIRSDQLKKI
jgi:sugar O-acyltransferase (sialic acid O-acetyltransferase NeuD family)